MSTITDGTTTFTPTLLMVADSTRESTNKVHRLLGGKIAVTLGDPVPRSGTLGFLLKGEALKEACVTLHATGSLFQLTEPDQPSTDMTYVLAEGGKIAVEQLRDYDDLWMVSIDFQEVTE
ncbi:MAG: hypothetical protein LCH36_00345 [Actinobacteria bacterium]|nr:hypothetical protein [Actinomycetota bacterium]